jgi:hypothetical protein
MEDVTIRAQLAIDTPEVKQHDLARPYVPRPPSRDPPQDLPANLQGRRR